MKHRLNHAAVTFRTSLTLQPRKLMAWHFIFALHFRWNTSSAGLLTVLPWIALVPLLQTKKRTYGLSFNFLLFALHPTRFTISHPDVFDAVLLGSCCFRCTLVNLPLCTHLPRDGCMTPTVTNYQAILPTIARTPANTRKSAVLATGNLS